AEVAGLDEAPEARRAGDVRTLADQDEAGVVADLERLEARVAWARRPRGDAPRLQTADRLRDRARVLRRRAAARAGDVEVTVERELAQERRGHVGRLVVAAERVREAGVRMARQKARRDRGKVSDVRPHLLRAQRAVDADDQRVGVLDRRPERVDRLAGEHAAREVD